MIFNNKLWIIFILVALMNGCERKTSDNTQTQTDVFLKENSVTHEIEKKLYEESAEESKVEIILKYDSSKKDRIVYVNRNVTELYFMKTAITKIEGLSQLKFLDTIVFDRTSFLQDFSFLTEVPQLKKLFVIWMTKNIDWSFIEQLPNLEVLYVEDYHLFDNGSYHQPKISIDLKNNKYLEYIGFTSGYLETFPTLINVPNSLKYLNLEGNKITSLPTDFYKYNFITVFMNINPIEKNTTIPSNVTMEWASSILDQKYQIPFDIPIISDFGD